MPSPSVFSPAEIMARAEELMSAAPNLKDTHFPLGIIEPLVT